MFLEAKIAFNNLMSLYLFLVLSFFISHYEVDARSNNRLERHSTFTISQDRNIDMLTMDNDQFRCVDIYKQPAFEHPLLKNHKIQLTPTFAIDARKRRSPNTGKGFNADNFTTRCPPGRVPNHKINTKHQGNIDFSSKREIKDIHHYSSQSYPGHHFATLDTTENRTYHGASARFSPYNLSLYGNQYSFSQMWLQSGPPTELNSIQVGWAVHPSLYGDNALHLTTYWTVDNYQKTGCFNYFCPGFMQIDPSNHLGDYSAVVNVIGSYEKVDFDVKVIQDKLTGNWWLIVSDDKRGDIQFGYWPKEIFTHLNGGSSLIRYGGETFSSTNESSPPMGSGELPETLFRNSAYIARLQIIDSDYNEQPINPDYIKIYCDTSSSCYDLSYGGDQGEIYGQIFLFGGPGGQCGNKIL